MIPPAACASVRRDPGHLRRRDPEWSRGELGVSQSQMQELTSKERANHRKTADQTSDDSEDL